MEAWNPRVVLSAYRRGLKVVGLGSRCRREGVEKLRIGLEEARRIRVDVEV